MAVALRKACKQWCAWLWPREGRGGQGDVLTTFFLAAGFEWREPGCSMCLAMNADKLCAARRALRFDFEPQFRRPPRLQGPHGSRVASHGRRYPLTRGSIPWTFVLSPSDRLKSAVCMLPEAPDQMPGPFLRRGVADENSSSAVYHHGLVAGPCDDASRRDRPSLAAQCCNIGDIRVRMVEYTPGYFGGPLVRQRAHPFCDRGRA